MKHSKGLILNSTPLLVCTGESIAKIKLNYVIVIVLRKHCTYRQCSCHNDRDRPDVEATYTAGQEHEAWEPHNAVCFVINRKELCQLASVIANFDLMVLDDIGAWIWVLVLCGRWVVCLGKRCCQCRTHDLTSSTNRDVRDESLQRRNTFLSKWLCYVLHRKCY